MISRWGLSLRRFLRRFSLRQRIVAMATLLVVAMMMPIPIGIIGQDQLLREQQRIMLALVDVDRLMLLASAEVATSQAQLLRYLQGTLSTLPVQTTGLPVQTTDGLVQTTGPEEAIAAANRALLHVDAALAQANPEQAARMQELRLDLGAYQALIDQVQADALGGEGDVSRGIASEAILAGDLLIERIEQVVGVSQASLDEANLELRQTARRSLLWAVVGELITVIGALALALVTARSITVPIESLRDAAERLGQGDLDVALPETGHDELSFLTHVFNEMASRLAASYRDLEQRVTRRTADLERRSQYMQAVINVSRATTDILDSEALVRQSVEVIRQRFDLYYVGLFLVDQSRPSIILQAGTGDAGRAMLSRGHELAFGQGMIGWCVANSRPRVSSEAAEDVLRVPNPFLPDTRSEAAIPLRARGRVIGALTVQDDRSDAFDQEAIELLQVMADLLAVAIENARLLNEVQATLDVAQRAYGQMTREGWLRVLRGRTKEYAVGTLPVDTTGLPVDTTGDEDGSTEGPADTRHRGEGCPSGQMVQQDRTLSVPIIARGVPLGAVRLTKSETAWTDGEKAMVATVVEQLGLALDSARLYEDTQIRAARERVAREVSDHMRATVDWDDLMQTAVQEIGQAVQASRVFVQWLPPDAAGTDHRYAGTTRRSGFVAADAQIGDGGKADAEGAETEAQTR